jgi:MiaB/RimO family radical SAM methylthiotransferase
LTCFKPANIIKNVKHQLSQGIKQIYLTSQDCSTYEYEGTQLVDIVRKVNEMDFHFFLRIGMINPRFLIDHLNQIESVMKFENVYQFLHIPIQSGSDKVLQKMNRPYRISDIIEPLDFLRKKFPYLSISTDIICGFPGETEYDFYQTINFIKWLQPEILNISKFTARPGTKAKKMNQVDSKVIKNRSVRLSKIFRNSFTKINEKWKEWEGEVLLLHKGTQENQAFARNFAYKNIFIENYHGPYGVFRKVKVYKIDGFNLMAKLKKKNS